VQQALRGYSRERKQEIRDETLSSGLFHSKRIIALILQDGSQAQLSRLISVLNPNNVASLLVPELIEAKYFLPSKGTLSNTRRSLPPTLADTWLPLLERCSSLWPHFLPALLDRLAERLVMCSGITGADSVNNARNAKLLQLWLLYILNSERLRTDAEFPLHSMLTVLMRAPSQWYVLCDSILC